MQRVSSVSSVTHSRENPDHTSFSASISKRCPPGLETTTRSTRLSEGRGCQSLTCAAPVCELTQIGVAAHACNDALVSRAAEAGAPQPRPGNQQQARVQRARSELDTATAGAHRSVGSEGNDLPVPVQTKRASVGRRVDLAAGGGGK